MKRAFRLTSLIIMAIVLLTVFCSCSGAASVNKPVPEEGKATVEITGSVTLEKVDENTITVHCTSNIEPNAVVVISLDSYNGERLSKQAVTVPGEGLRADFEIDSKWQGKVYGTLSMTPSDDGKQPKEVQEKYGNKLQNLTGEHILYNSKGNLVCIQSEPIEF